MRMNVLYVLRSLSSSGSSSSCAIVSAAALEVLPSKVLTPRMNMKYSAHGLEGDSLVTVVENEFEDSTPACEVEKVTILKSAQTPPQLHFLPRPPCRQRAYRSSRRLAGRMELLYKVVILVATISALTFILLFGQLPALQ